MSTRTPDPERRPAPVATPGMSRRDVLTRAAGAAGVATVTAFWFEGFGEPLRRREVEPTAPGAPARTFTAAEWRTLEAATERLLPTAPDSPGARTVNAIGYLDAVLQQPHIEPDTLPLIREGAQKLDARARAGGAADFASLPVAQQDAAIRVFETWQAPDGTYPGHAWLRKMLSFVLEAFFGDPIHGGNPNEVAWKWAGHKPGFPRPEQPGWRMRERPS